MIRALVVDDSSFMRKAISMMLERASDISVVGTAINGLEGVEKACELKPDVITMDVEMPKMDGITAVKKIMKQEPCPILMVSSLTKEGAEVTIDALQAGAADFIPKQHSHTSLQIREIQDELVEKVRALSRSSSQLFQDSSSATETEESVDSTSAPDGAAPSRRSLRREGGVELVVIGASTGGPLALQHVLPALPGELSVPVAVVQHMPPHFTRSLADRLDSLSELDVMEASDGQVVKAGQAVVGAGGHHLTFSGRGSDLVVHTPVEPEDISHCPSVDVMFESACGLYGDGVLGLVMTGMGKDGLRGARQIKKLGGTVYVQDEASCVVYGMPRAVEEAGLADGIFPRDQLAEAVAEATGAAALS